MRAKPLLVIAGPTASGKSALGVAVAERLHGEIISADAVAVYRGLDIGSDKPDAELRQRIPHHLIDVAEPDERFSAGLFCSLAEAAISGVRSRNRLPIVVGGSHLYLQALLQGLAPLPPRDAAVKARLAAAWDADQAALADRLAAVDPESAARIGRADRQRIIRALEVHETTGITLSEHWRRQPRRVKYRALVVSPQRSLLELYARIEMRVDRMFAAGLVAEVRQLLASGVPRGAHAFSAIGYQQVIAVLEETYDLPAAVARTKLSSRRLARRQLSWLRRFQEGMVTPVPPAEKNGADTVIRLWSQFREGSEA